MPNKDGRKSVGFTLEADEYKLWMLTATKDNRSLAAEIRDAMAERVRKILGNAQEKAKSTVEEL